MGRLSPAYTPMRLSPLSLRWGVVGALLWHPAPVAAALTAGEARFFESCSVAPPHHLHDEQNPWDLHAIPYTVFGFSQVQIIRTLDWVMDAAWPGPTAQPLDRLMETARHGYHRLPPWWLLRRSGELVYALQLRELTWGDTTAAYSLVTDGSGGPGSGMVVRVNHVLDWTQHLCGDGNRLLGLPLRRPQGLITWRGPTQAVDGLQGGLLKAFSQASMVVARLVDGVFDGVEVVGDAAWNMFRAPPHPPRAVFLRMPMGVYRAHELWFLEHRRRLIIGTPEQFQATTHAALRHQRGTVVLMEWTEVDRSYARLEEVAVLASPALIARAPATLQAYVVPAAWVLDEAALTISATASKLETRRP